jgi:hypothetical protein
MSIYNVTIFREMRLLFRGIEADSPKNAAIIARHNQSSDADDIDDCNGETLAALVDEVDVKGDTLYDESCVIDFEAGRLLNVAPTYHENALYLDSIMPDVQRLPDDAPVEIVITAKAVKDIRAAIAKATAA